MKLGPGQVIFRSTTYSPNRKLVQFCSKQNTIQLLETALVIEGYRQRFFFPVVDRFFQQALSEWTTVTIPYSRISTYQYLKRTTARRIVLVCIWGGVVSFLVLLMSYFDSMSIVNFTLWSIFLVPVAALAHYLAHQLLTSRNKLIYRQADGWKVLLSFRIPNAKRQSTFTEQLQSYRDAAIQKTGAKPDKVSQHDLFQPVLGCFLILMILHLMIQMLTTTMTVTPFYTLRLGQIALVATALLWPFPFSRWCVIVGFLVGGLYAIFLEEMVFVLVGDFYAGVPEAARSRWLQTVAGVCWVLAGFLLGILMWRRRITEEPER